MEDIFDTKNILYIPVSLKNQLSGLRHSKQTKELLSLFKIKNRLTIDEILVGLYRKYKRQQSRVWVTYTAYNLTRKGIIKRFSVGEYGLVKNIEEI